MANYFDCFDHFERISGSKVWPSSDPTDSPFDTFVCKHCGSSKRILMGGTHSAFGSSFEDEARKTLTNHLQLCPQNKANA